VRPPILEVQVGSKLIIMVTSMNPCQPPIEDSSTHRVTQEKKPIVQPIIVFVSYLLTYLQFKVIKWAKQHPGQNPTDVKSNEAIQI
jgi:hypothetical protein